MAAKRQYGSPEFYERKLKSVMERLGVPQDDVYFNWDRFGGFVQFRYNGQLYRFEHSIEKAAAKGHKLKYGTDAFAQVVLSLEDLARMVERGIYDLSTWVAGMKFLPPATVVPECFATLGFVEIPSGPEEVKERYRTLAKERHPDAGGSAEGFHRLTEASEKCLRHFEKVGVLNGD